MMRLFGSEKIAGVVDRLGMRDDEALEAPMLNSSIERAQKKVEENNFGIRKRLLEYDDVMNSQREVIYTKRRNALSGERVEIDVMNMMQDISQIFADKAENYDYELHVSMGIPSPEVRGFFKLEDAKDCYCLKLERVRGNENYPFVVFESWFNPEIGVCNDDNFNVPLYELLESKCGIVVHTSVEEISAQLAGNRIAQKLRISEHDPILKRKRFVYDINGKPIEYNVGYYKADSFTYTITSER